MKILVIGTINGQENEGMRNVATHLSRAFEKDHTVLRSGLKDVYAIIVNSRKSEVTMIFARANRMIYWLARVVEKLCKHVWIVCVQKPDKAFEELTNRRPLKCNYLSLVESDVREIRCADGKHRHSFSPGIDTAKFAPVSPAKSAEIKTKYGFSLDKPLVIHVGHCSAGRGLDDFIKLDGGKAQRLVVASGMFEDAATANRLTVAGVKIHKGYLEHIEEVYQMADVYLFPTRSTEYVISIPLSVMEALSCGTPVIGYRDFDSIRAIPSNDGAVTLIDSADELDGLLPKVASYKQERSLLAHSTSWEEEAEKILALVGEEV